MQVHHLDTGNMIIKPISPEQVQQIVELMQKVQPGLPGALHKYDIDNEDRENALIAGWIKDELMFVELNIRNITDAQLAIFREGRKNINLDWSERVTGNVSRIGFTYKSEKIQNTK